MADVARALKRYVDEMLTLDMKDIQASASSRDWFLKRIKNEIDTKLRVPVLHSDEPFIRFGSYFKGTKVANVDEFDILVVIDSNRGQYTSNNRVIGKGVGSANPNYKYNSRYYKEDGSGVSSQKMVWWLQGIVNSVVQSFGGEPVEEDGISVKARIKSKDIAIDLVPCGIFTKVDTGKRFYNIGDGSNSWTLTAPRDDINRLNNVAGKRSDFKNVIRICKRIKEKYQLSVSSFAIETAIVDMVYSYYWSGNIVDNTVNAMTYLAGVLEQSSIRDPFDNSNLLQSSLSYDYDKRVYQIIGEEIHELKNSLLFSDNDCYGAIYNMFENLSW